MAQNTVNRKWFRGWLAMNKFHLVRPAWIRNSSQKSSNLVKSSHCVACIEVQIYCPLNITIIVQITGNKNECTLSEHVKLYPKCQYFVGAPLLSSTALILLGMEFTRAAQVVAGILFHSFIMTSRSCWMLDTWCFSTFLLGGYPTCAQ